jgi:trk system potassium uptake protein
VNIIIAGAGKVGYRLAGTLSHRHNVTIVDKNEAALQRLLESIDVFTVTGDIEDPDTYRPLKSRHFDIFIAVTDSDEANILSTLIVGDVIKADQKIVRLKNRYFADSTIADKLGISTAVFPFTATANAIATQLDYPHANNIKSFIYSPFRMISVFVHVAGESGIPIIRFNHEKCAVAGIERAKRFFVPLEDETLQQGDLVYLFGDPEIVKAYSAELNPDSPMTINRVAIFGADLLGLEIAKSLLQRGIRLKVIDKDMEKCRKASELLQEDATVINSRYIEHTLFSDEQIGRADMAIFTSKEDEENIIRSLEAKEQGIPRTVAINNDLERYSLMHSLGITAARGPKSTAYYTILEKIGSSAIISERHYCGGAGAIFSRKVFGDSSLVDKMVRPPDPRKCLGFILRDGLLLPWLAKLRLHRDDVLFLFLDSAYNEEIKQWIYAL